MTRRLVLAAMAFSLIGASAASAALVQFRTPSGNIGCIGETARADNSIRCDISRRSWSPPPKPRSCELDWGNGLSLDRRGRARFVCAGDTALNTGPKLAYGKQRAIGAIVCLSRTSGLTCTNADGHGFTMRRTGYRRF